MGALQAVRSNNAFQPTLSVVAMQSRLFARWSQSLMHSPNSTRLC
jgi:hypothetical protein